MVEDQDRWSEVLGKWTGRRDAKEEAQWLQIVAIKHGLYELEQGDITYKGPRARSRLDRVYTNQHTSCQQDQRVACVALRWPQGVSDHRPIAFYRRKISKAPGRFSAPEDNVYKDKTWARKAAGIFFQSLKEAEGEGKSVSGIRQLVLGKQAMVEAAEEIKSKRKYEKQRREEEDAGMLGKLIACTRAVEKNI